MFDNINFLHNTIITKPAVKAISAFSTGLDFGKLGEYRCYRFDSYFRTI